MGELGEIQLTVSMWVAEKLRRVFFFPTSFFAAEFHALVIKHERSLGYWSDRAVAFCPNWLELSRRGQRNGRANFQWQWRGLINRGANNRSEARFAPRKARTFASDVRASEAGRMIAAHCRDSGSLNKGADIRGV